MWEKAVIEELALEAMVLVLRLSLAYLIRFGQKLVYRFLFGSSST